MPTTAIQGNGGASCTAVDPLPRRSPVEKIAVAAVSGTLRKELIARVASLNVNKPKLASSTSQFMKFEIAGLSPSRHCDGTSRSQPGMVPSGRAKDATASAAKPIQIATAADALMSGERFPS